MALLSTASFAVDTIASCHAAAVVGFMLSPSCCHFQAIIEQCKAKHNVCGTSPAWLGRGIVLERSCTVCCCGPVSSHLATMSHKPLSV